MERSIKVKAIFRGQDGSCGYCKDKQYEILIEPCGKNFSIIRFSGGGYCEYESIFSFLENWDNIRRF